MSLVTYTKSYKVVDRENVVIYTDFNRKITNVFYEIFGSIEKDWTHEQIIKYFREDFKPIAKSQYSVEFNTNRIDFYKPNCTVFPVMYVINKN